MVPLLVLTRYQRMNNVLKGISEDAPGFKAVSDEFKIEEVQTDGQ